MTEYVFEITQPPGQQPPVASGSGCSLADIVTEAGHYHRQYARQGRARVEVYEERGGKRKLMLMATTGTAA